MAFLLGLLTHFVLDAIPHIDPGTFHNFRIPGFQKEIDLETVHDEDKPWPLWIYVFAFSEFIFAWALIIILFYHKPNFWIVVAGGFGGIFVDILDNPVFNYFLGWPIIKQIHWLHHRTHYDLTPNKWYWGLIFEIIVIGLSLWVLLI